MILVVVERYNNHVHNDNIGKDQWFDNNQTSIVNIFLLYNGYKSRIHLEAMEAVVDDCCHQPGGYL